MATNDDTKQQQQDERKDYPGIVVKAHGTMATITKDTVAGSAVDSFLGSPLTGPPS